MVAATLGDAAARNAARRAGGAVRRPSGSAGVARRPSGSGGWSRTAPGARRRPSGARGAVAPPERGTAPPEDRRRRDGGVRGCGYGRAWTCAPTAFDQAFPAVASQLVDQVMAPRRVGHACAGLKVPQPVSLVRQSIALFTTDGAT